MGAGTVEGDKEVHVTSGSQPAHRSTNVKKMKYNVINQDRVVVFYNDGIDTPKEPLGRWEFRFGGTKASKGFAPMYTYDIDTRELTALVQGPVRLPAMSAMEFHRAAVDAALSGGLWARLMSDDEIIRALDIALECSRGERRRALFFANRLGNFNLMKEALSRTDIKFCSMSGETLLEERERIIDEFNSEYRRAEGDPVVLLLTDAFATGISFRDPRMVLVHLDFPARNPATVGQREGRVRRMVPDPASGKPVMNDPTIYSVSLDIDSKIAESRENESRFVNELQFFPGTRLHNRD
jgi:SNF2 family DNA or RNA helicase